MIRKYKTVSIVYGGSGRKYADALNNKIESFSEIERYPLSSKIIMERILTTELLSNVMNLFKESEFCVAFLTADDCFKDETGTRYRVRQNVVFELGMALIQLGRERCIILSDFDIRAEKVELPSDMNSLEIRQFDSRNFNEVMDDIVSKLLQFSKNSNEAGICLEKIPQYNKLLTRNEYFVDYENIFVEDNNVTSNNGTGFFAYMLDYWYKECESLPHFDEKCIYIFERIGFLPIFGQIQEVNNFIVKLSMLVENYKNSDISYYGGTNLLNFAKNLVINIIEYTRIKSNTNETIELYEKLLDDFLFEEVPSDTDLNPLMAIVYYDYLGLTYLKLARLKDNDSNLQLAQESFKKALEFVSKVDMSMQIWSGFLTYNIARTYAAQKQIDEATKYYKKAIKIRERWLKNAKFNIDVRNALSYEYFIAKIDYIDMCSKCDLLTSDEVLREYGNVETELNTYSDIDDKLNQLTRIRLLLLQRKKDEADAEALLNALT